MQSVPAPAASLCSTRRGVEVASVSDEHRARWEVEPSGFRPLRQRRNPELPTDADNLTRALVLEVPVDGLPGLYRWHLEQLNVSEEVNVRGNTEVDLEGAHELLLEIRIGHVDVVGTLHVEEPREQRDAPDRRHSRVELTLQYRRTEGRVVGVRKVNRRTLVGLAESVIGDGRRRARRYLSLTSKLQDCVIRFNGHYTPALAAIRSATTASTLVWIVASEAP